MQIIIAQIRVLKEGGGNKIITDSNIRMINNVPLNCNPMHVISFTWKVSSREKAEERVDSSSSRQLDENRIN